MRQLSPDEERQCRRLAGDATHFRATALFFANGGGHPKDEQHRRELVAYFHTVADRREDRWYQLRGMVR